MRDRHRHRGAMETVSEPSTTTARPTMVTVAAYLIMVGSVFVVLVVWDRIAGLHSLDTRKALQPLVDDPQMRKLGVQVDDLLVVIKTLSLVAAGCATAMVILGYQTLQRNRGARLALTVLAVPLFLTGLATGGYASSVVAVAVATLWLQPARSWFDGSAAPVAAGPAARSNPSARPVWPPPYTPPAAEDRPPSPVTPPGEWAPPPLSAYDVPPVARPGSRPRTLGWACAVTWVFSALAAVALVSSILVLAASPSLVLDKMHEQNPDLATQGIGDHTILVVGFVTCGVFLAWCVVSAVLAVLAFRRTRWAYYALLVSTALVAMLCLVGVVGSVVMVVPLLAAVVVVACLARPEVRSWFG
jgi:hypothetical protein